MKKPLNVAVLMGGWSKEREVSLVSGKAALEALKTLGHRGEAFDIDRDIIAFATRLRAFQPDVVFNALHGVMGEDGNIQGLLNMMQIPYTHSGVLASSLAMNKIQAKKAFASAGLRVANGKQVTRDDLLRGDPIPRPYVVKPVAEGSSVGVVIVHKNSNAPDLSDPMFHKDLMVEAYIPGRELTVAVMGDANTARALSVTELVSKNSFYDYEAKYTDGVTTHIIPADIPADIFKRCLDEAVRAHQALDCRGISRADFRYDAAKTHGDDLYILEVNTQPGLTPLSLSPEQAMHCGIAFPQLVQWMLDHAAFDRLG